LNLLFTGFSRVTLLLADVGKKSIGAVYGAGRLFGRYGFQVQVFVVFRKVGGAGGIWNAENERHGNALAHHFAVVFGGLPSRAVLYQSQTFVVTGFVQ